MKFFTLFAVGAAASAVVKRDLATVQAAIQSISDATMRLQTGIQGFNGAGQAASLQQASQNVIDAINQANSDVAGTSALTGSDALQLPGPIGDLSKLVMSSTQAAVSKKQTFVSAGVGGVVYDQLVQIRDASNTFTNTLLSKVPEGLRTIGRNLAAPISQALNNAVQQFSDQQGSGSSSSGSSSATSSSSGSSSATPSSYPTGSSSAAVTTSSAAASTSSAAASTSSAAASSSVAVVPTSSAAGGAGAATSSVAPPQYTGAASHQVAGFGAAAVAALAAVAAF